MDTHCNWGLPVETLLVRPFHLEDFDKIKPLYSTIQVVPDFDVDDMMDGERIVVVVEEVASKTPVVIAGLEPIWPGRWSSWLYPGEPFRDHYRSVYKVASRVLNLFMSSYDVRRLEATVEVDFPEGRRWLEHLGFELEGLLRRYDLDGQAHYQYSLVDWDGTQRITN